MVAAAVSAVTSLVPVGISIGILGHTFGMISRPVKKGSGKVRSILDL